jgi:hypothetical protein
MVSGHLGEQFCLEPWESYARASDWTVGIAASAIIARQTKTERCCIVDDNDETDSRAPAAAQTGRAPHCHIGLKW